MPQRPNRACGVPGCKNYQPCPIHKKDDRSSAHQRGYDSKWQKVRKTKLMMNPLAECGICPVIDCKDRGRTIPADMVHHIKPIRTHPELRLAWKNLMSVNQNICHAKIEAL